MAKTARATPKDPHIPVLLGPLLDAVAPVTGLWLDGTFGAGGYARGLLDAGASRVIAVDRDPSVFAMAKDWASEYGDKITMVEGTFGQLDEYGDQLLDGIVLDLGVSSMQLDQAERGFSFMQDGPLDMRMSADGPTAADLVNTLSDEAIADMLYLYGEERASRRIARAILRAREIGPIETTGELARIIQSVMPRPKPGQAHSATRSFQAIRIAVNDEYGQLAQGLQAAERALKSGGALAVVTFHSIEDRMVKRFFQHRSGAGGQGSRHAPAQEEIAPRFEVLTRRAVTADADELSANPRARSAKLRVARRTDAPSGAVDPVSLGMPNLLLRDVIR